MLPDASAKSIAVSRAIPRNKRSLANRELHLSNPLAEKPAVHCHHSFPLCIDDPTYLQIDEHKGEPTMNVKWNLVILKLLSWLLAEIVLNTIDLDFLADCSEFCRDRQQAAIARVTHI